MKKEEFQKNFLKDKKIAMNVQDYPEYESLIKALGMEGQIIKLETNDIQSFNPLEIAASHVSATEYVEQVIATINVYAKNIKGFTLSEEESRILSDELNASYYAGESHTLHSLVQRLTEINLTGDYHLTRLIDLLKITLD